MEQTIINGFRVIIFKGYDGTQLFIDNPAGENIFAHRVSGNPVKRAKEIIGYVKPDSMICVSSRRSEFTEALGRGKDNSFEVFADWEKDAFVVVNRTNKTEYKVILETRENRLFGKCSCPDFKYRKRTCKHLGEVLVDALFGAACF